MESNEKQTTVHSDTQMQRPIVQAIVQVTEICTALVFCLFVFLFSSICFHSGSSIFANLKTQRKLNERSHCKHGVNLQRIYLSLPFLAF